MRDVGVRRILECMQRILASFVIALLAPTQAFAASACTAPLTYSLGAVDSRFGVSSAQLVEYLAQAEAVWEAPSGKNLFQYRASGGAVSVNLLYDSRQATTDTQKATLAKLSAIKTVFDLISTQLRLVASSTRAEQDSLQATFALYQQDETRFNADVAASNAAGGASPETFASFQARKQALTTRFTDLKAQETALNDKAKRINALGDVLDTTAAAVNTYIAQYNAALAKTGEYEEGYYKEDAGVRSIGIYQFTDSTALVRALAHEFGHALGMNHVADSSAIMFAKNQATSTTAMPADIAALDAACGF